MSRVYVLGGRIFSVPEQTTARQDAYMIAQAVDAGVMAFAGKALNEDVALQLSAALFRSGRLEYVLAGGLVEDGKKWTAKDAEANADFFGELTDPESKQQVLTGVVEVLAAFFRGAPLSSTPSPNASTVAQPEAEPSNGDTSSIDDVELMLAGTGAR